jgi:hypothetical protein
MLVEYSFTITAVNWRPSDDDGEQIITGASLSYKYKDDNWGTVSGGPRLGIETPLAYSDERLFHNFLRLGLDPGLEAKLDALSEKPEDNDPLVLESGTLAELLHYGIGPTEAWTFLINHGGARRKTMLLLSANILDPNAGFVARELDPWPKARRKRELLQTAVLRCSQAARSLCRLQSVDMSEALAAGGAVSALSTSVSGSSQTKAIQPAEARIMGPHTALAGKSTDALIIELERTAKILKSYMPVFRRDRQRPDNPDAAEFCREWYRLPAL